jgi:hypothetical protein
LLTSYRKVLSSTELLVEYRILMPLVSFDGVLFRDDTSVSPRRWNSDVDRKVELQADWEAPGTAGFRLFVMLTVAEMKLETCDPIEAEASVHLLLIHYLHVTSVFILSRRSGMNLPWNRCDRT